MRRRLTSYTNSYGYLERWQRSEWHLPQRTGNARGVEVRGRCVEKCLAIHPFLFRQGLLEQYPKLEQYGRMEKFLINSLMIYGEYF